MSGCKTYSRRHDHVSSRFVRREWGNSYALNASPLPDQRDLIQPPEFKPATIRRRKGEDVRLSANTTTEETK